MAHNIEYIVQNSRVLPTRRVCIQNSLKIFAASVADTKMNKYPPDKQNKKKKNELDYEI